MLKETRQKPMTICRLPEIVHMYGQRISQPSNHSYQTLPRRHPKEDKELVLKSRYGYEFSSASCQFCMKSHPVWLGCSLSEEDPQQRSRFHPHDHADLPAAHSSCLHASFFSSQPSFGISSENPPKDVFINACFIGWQPRKSSKDQTNFLPLFSLPPKKMYMFYWKPVLQNTRKLQKQLSTLTRLNLLNIFTEILCQVHQQRKPGQLHVHIFITDIFHIYVHHTNSFSKSSAHDKFTHIIKWISYQETK